MFYIWFLEAAVGGERGGGAVHIEESQQLIVYIQTKIQFGK